MTKEARTFAEKMAACAAEIGPIVNDDTNKHFKYGFTSIDAILARVTPIMGKHGLYHGLIDFSKDAEHTYTQADLVLQLEITDGVGKACGRFIGQGLDTQDKAANKAMIAAYKFGLIMLFGISRPGAADDADGAPPVDPAKTRPAAQGQRTTGSAAFAPQAKAPAAVTLDPAIQEAADLLKLVKTPEELESWVTIHSGAVAKLPDAHKKAVGGAVAAVGKKLGVPKEVILAWLAEAHSAAAKAEAVAP